MENFIQFYNSIDCSYLPEIVRVVVAIANESCAPVRFRFKGLDVRVEPGADPAEVLSKC
jgi:hypothetical protein